MNVFYINDDPWHVEYVKPYSPELVDRFGRLTVATTDPKSLTVYISEGLSNEYKTEILLHELGHCFIFSYHLEDDIRRFVYPEYWEEAEEWICNFIAKYGYAIFQSAYSILGNDAWIFVPYKLDNIFR